LAFGECLGKLNLHWIYAGDVVHDHADFSAVLRNASVPLGVGERVREDRECAGALLETIGKGMGTLVHWFSWVRVCTIWRDRGITRHNTRHKLTSSEIRRRVIARPVFVDYGAVPSGAMRTGPICPAAGLQVRSGCLGVRSGCSGVRQKST